MPSRAYYAAHRALLAEQTRRAYYARQGRAAPVKRPTGRFAHVDPRPPVVRRKVRKPPVPAIPDLDAHPLVEAALAALSAVERAEIGDRMDSIGRDLVGEYCLAAVAGEDPAAAMEEARARFRRDRAVLIHDTWSVTA